MSKNNVVFDIESLAQQKSIDRSVVYHIVEEAMAAVVARKYPEGTSIRIDIDPDQGTQQAFRTWTVVEDDAEELLNPEVAGAHITLSEAQDIDEEAKLGEQVEQKIEMETFGRIDAQQAKQLIVKLIREAERENTAEQYQRRIGEIITGVVKRATRDTILLDLSDNLEAMIPRQEMIPRESVRIGDRLRGYFYALNTEPRGPLLLLSRSCPEMLLELFKIEVPEISEGLIEIRGASRDPGSRAKIAVSTQDARIDPIGACVGMRGSRVQAVSNELNGERIDIVLWDDDVTQMVINAMSPAEVLSIAVDEQKREMNIAVSEERLAQAIGRNGQNIRLASELLKWSLNVMSQEEADKQEMASTADIRTLLSNQLEIDDEITDILIREGFGDLQEIAQCKQADMEKIEEFDADMAAELISRAQSALLSGVIVSEDTANVQADLMRLDGVDEALADKLIAMGVNSREELAELSVDDLTEDNRIDRKIAGDLIMQARAPWFKEDDEKPDS